LELLMNGAFSPLTGFLNQKDYESVLQSMRLADGTLWPMPITLDVTEEAAAGLETGVSLALRDPEGVMLAVLEVGDIWRPDIQQEAQCVYGAQESAHPGVTRLLDHANPVYVGGRIKGVEPPSHYDFKTRRHTPAALRAEFERLGWRRIAAFHT